MSSVARDTTPGLLSAGRVTHSGRLGVADCFQQPAPPQTPDNIRRFRQGATCPLGRSGQHPGLAVDGPRRTDVVYGAHSKKDGSVVDCLSPSKISLVAERPMQQELREPLGRTAVHPGIKLPEATQKPNFAFGVTSNKSENARNVMYPAADIAGAEPDPKRECGYQKDRQYDWTVSAINPNTHRFGKPMASGGHVELSTAPPTAVIVNSPTKAQRALRHGDIGSPKRMGYAPVLDETHSYGKTLPKDEFTVNELLKGIGAPPLPDFDDVGKSCARNPHLRRTQGGSASDELRTSTETRTFGVPSVRTDLAAPKHTKITSNVNYGTDPSAAQLLYPTPLGEDGLGLKPLSLGEAQTLSQRCGFELTPEQVELCYKVALRNSGPRMLVSARSFTAAIEQAGF